MPVTMHTRADNGQEIAQITPTPRAHVGLVHQPTYSTVLEVSSGQVLELTNGPSLYCGGYASGFNRLMTMNTAPIVAVNMPKAHNVTAAQMYAEWYDGQRADAKGLLHPDHRPTIQVQRLVQAKATEQAMREVAQWWSAGGFADGQIITSLPDAIRRRCYQYGQLVSWQLLPEEAKQAAARRLVEIRAQFPNDDPATL